MERINPNGTINLTREVAEELAALGWSGCMGDSECACTAQQHELNHEITTDYIRKHGKPFSLSDAIQLAAEAHDGQLDKVGEDYILHPLRVMFAFPPYMPKQRMVAVLHDVIEDTDFTIEDLEVSRVPEDVLTAVACISYTDVDRAAGWSYLDFIKKKVLTNELARQVKIEDIKDNMSMERLLRLDKDTQERLLKKYTSALDVLEGKSLI